MSRPARSPLFLTTLLALAVTGADAKTPLVQVLRIGTGFVTDLSADGKTAVGQMNSNFETFRWTEETGMVGLGRNMYIRMGGAVSGLPAVSADGRSVASTIIDDTRTHGTQGLWTVDAGWTQLAPPLPADGGVMDTEDSSVYGISRDGKVVTGLYWRPFQSGGSAHGSVWTAATNMQGLPTAGGSARIDDANGDGSVLVGWEEDPVNGGRQATVWVGGVKSKLEAGSDWPSEAERVNTDGTVIVGQALNPVTQREEGALWRWNGTSWDKTSLGAIPGTTGSGYCYANGVSDAGDVVVGFCRPKFSVFQTTAFIWTPESGAVNLNTWLASQGAGFHGKRTAVNAMGLSADGLSMAIVTRETAPPFKTLSLLIRRSPPVAPAKRSAP